MAPRLMDSDSRQHRLEERGLQPIVLCSLPCGSDDAAMSQHFLPVALLLCFFLIN